MADVDVSQFLGGYVPDPAATAAFEAEIARRRPVALRDAAPQLMRYGQEGDLMPYLAYYETEWKNPDGTIFKPKGEEPPYGAQTGNNCTGISTAHLIDLLQAMDAAEGRAEVHVTSVEATYAFGLATAGMRGDRGCYGSALAKAVNTIGAVDCATVGAPFREDASRLQAYARNPAEVVAKYRSTAAAFKCDEIVKITRIEEALAWFANKGLLILPSNVGFANSMFGNGAGPRDARGIVPARGTWPHQMFGGGVIRSDGVDTVVIFQSWGRNVPAGPQPFRLPSFGFRSVFRDFERILADNDVWGIRKFNNFGPLTPDPIPDRWTSHGGWMAI